MRTLFANPQNVFVHKKDGTSTTFSTVDEIKEIRLTWVVYSGSSFDENSIGGKLAYGFFNRGQLLWWLPCEELVSVSVL